MAATRRKTDDVLATARKDLQIQLAVVREEIGRLATEERALIQALSSLNGEGAPSQATAPEAKVAGSSPPGEEVREHGPRAEAEHEPPPSRCEQVNRRPHQRASSAACRRPKVTQRSRRGAQGLARARAAAPRCARKLSVV